LWLNHAHYQAIFSELVEWYDMDVFRFRMVENRTGDFESGRTEFADLRCVARKTPTLSVKL
jgi:hypothetical protein